MYRLIAIFSISLLLFTSCREDRPEYGFVRLVFQHVWDDESLQLHRTEPYVNAAGNSLVFDRLQYIISDLRIDGEELIRIESPEVHFISINGDTTILITYQIPVGDYSLLSFNFGLNEHINQSNAFPNLPGNMPWPVGMGGGYHYMMIDGWWTSPTTPQSRGFGLHLGALEVLVDVFTRIDTTWGFNVETETLYVSQIRTQIDSIFERHHHFLRVETPRVFTVEPNTITTLEPIVMNVRQWMEDPHLWDFDEIGGQIMSNRPALDMLATNAESGVFRGARVTRGQPNPTPRIVTVISYR